MRDQPACYRRIDPPRGAAAPDGIWLSPEDSDPMWDDFLRSIPCGQYQQSSLWAQFKATEGWHHHRMVVMGDDGITGGFQILWKKKRFAKVGYVSKGPVAHPDHPDLQRELARLLTLSAAELGLSAMIVQSPDEAEALLGSTQDGFIQSNPMKVIESTYLVDVSAGMDAVRRRMHRNVRQCVRKSRELGVRVRPGTEADLPLFFKLMSETCRRQNSSPNPASLESLRRLWQIFSGCGSVEMAFASKDGQDIAGRMNLVFGNRVTQWKKGWDGTNATWHPNELLADHALEWAHAHGHRLCDFSAINRLTALRILGGQPTDAGVARSRDMFNLRLGGHPKLLPRAQIHLPNPVLRLCYRHFYVRMEQKRERRLLAERT